MGKSSIGGASRTLTQGVARYATGLAVEAGWTTAHLMMYPIGLLSESAGRGLPRHDLAGMTPHQRGLVHHDVNAAATPILLVHGIVDNHSIFSVLERALRRRGFADISSFDYGVLTRDVRRTAERLAEVIERLAADSGYERIHVIGHSLGGLITRYYIQRMGGDARVHTLVTLGTPHQGTTLATAGKLVPLLRQLAPGSDLIRELAEPAPDCRTRFVAFHSDLDHLIVPSRNARIEHPDLNARNVSVSGVGHLSLTNNRRIAHDIATTLRELEPSNVGNAQEAGP